MLIISICKCFLAFLVVFFFFFWLKLKSQQFFQVGEGSRVGEGLQPETKVHKDRTEPFYG